MGRAFEIKFRSLFIFIFAVALRMPLAAAFEVDGGSLLATAAYARLVDNAVQSLPEKVRVNLPPNQRFRTEAGQSRAGRLESGEVLISQTLLNAYAADDSDRSYREAVPTSRHPNFKTFLVATVVHELAHLYDARLQLSQSDEFQFALYRHRFGNLPAAYERGNFEERRATDSYEFKNRREAFAVNFEYFLLDPQFACKRPSMVRFYERHFGVRPNARAQCAGTSKTFYLAPDVTGTDSFEPTFFKPRGKLYAIHYLLAGPGEGVVSEFGHSMLRLIYCAPERKMASDDCLYDVSEHVVVSPSAGVVDLQISYLAGMSGKYPSTFFAAKLSQIIERYNRIEEREIVSVPLKLSQEQLEDFEQAVIESHWTYKGKYFFNSNNCAVEVLNLIKRSMPDNVELRDIYANTPKRLFQQLGALDLVANSDFSYWQNDRTKRYYFPALTPTLKKLMAFVAANTGRADASRYFELSPERRLEILASTRTIERTPALRVLSALRALEMNLNMKKRLRVMKVVATELTKTPDLHAVRNTLRSSGQLWVSPSDLLSNAEYGVPSDSEINKSVADRETALSELNQDKQSLREYAKALEAKIPVYRELSESDQVLSKITAEE